MGYDVILYIHIYPLSSNPRNQNKRHCWIFWHNSVQKYHKLLLFEGTACWKNLANLANVRTFHKHAHTVKIISQFCIGERRRWSFKFFISPILSITRWGPVVLNIYDGVKVKRDKSTTCILPKWQKYLPFHARPSKTFFSLSNRPSQHLFSFHRKLPHIGIFTWIINKHCSNNSAIARV